MAISAGTVYASLILETKDYTENLKNAIGEMKLFAVEGKTAQLAAESFKTALSQIETVVGKGFSYQIKAVGDSVASLNNNYTAFSRTVGDYNKITSAAIYLEKLSKEAAAAAGSVEKLGEAYNKDAISVIDLITAKKRSALAAELKEFTNTSNQKTAALEAETKTQETFLKSFFAFLSSSYKTDGVNFKLNETEKTSVVQRELRVRETAYRKSMEQIISMLRGYTVMFGTIGTEYGNALLQGITSTKNQITSYLNGLKASIREFNNATGSGGIGGYATGTENADRGLAVVGEYGMPEIVDFSGGEKVLAFNRSIELMSTAATAAAGYTTAVAGVLRSVSEPEKSSAFDYEAFAAAVNKQGAEGYASIIYSPTYNSPVEVSIDEMRRKDIINMRRLGLSF